jgi:hypothetical protein
MTVGHTGGDAASDQNHHMRKISVLVGEEVMMSAALDTEKQELQTIRLTKPAPHVRVRIDETKAGGRLEWNEACVSELEAWGTPSGPTGAYSSPTVDVEPHWDHEPIADLGAACAAFIADTKKDHETDFKVQRAAQVACQQEGGTDCDGPEEWGEPSCTFKRLTKVEGKGPFVELASILFNMDSKYGHPECSLYARTDEGWWSVIAQRECDPAVPITIGDLKADPDKLTFRFSLVDKTPESFVATCLPAYLSDTPMCTYKTKN